MVKNLRAAAKFLLILKKCGHKVPALSPQPKDEVDTYMRKSMSWIRYLYSTETNIGDEIDRRIDNLKLADKLEGNEFDWEEFEQNKKEFEQLEEDFEVNLDG